MSGTPQPHLLSVLVSGFASADASHGFAVNLIAVIAARGGRRGLPEPEAPRASGRRCLLLVVFCLADWVLIEDFGFFGGLGTDPNSMMPVALLAVGGYLALVQARGCRQAAARSR